MKFQWPINDKRRTRTLQKLRSPRMAQTLPKEEIDDWLKQSISLVAGSVRGLATNQRRIRYFGFEGQNDEVKK